MVDEILSFFKEFNLQTIISLVVVMWYFTKDIKLSIDKLDKDIREMNSRVSRMEGTVYGKDVYKNISEQK